MKKSSLGLAVVILAGCTLSPTTHKAPEPITIDNEKFVNQPIDKVWTLVANQFFNDTFTLKSSDKATKTIVASFTTDRPINYIDCGIVKRKYKDSNKVWHPYTYNYAEPTQYIYEKNGHVYDAKVTASLDAEITTKVTKKESGSLIAIEVNYILNREITSTEQNKGTKLPPEKQQIKFTTKEPYKTEGYSCISNGTIENNLLNNIN